jgi:hypothetical protein
MRVHVACNEMHQNETKAKATVYRCNKMQQKAAQKGRLSFKNFNEITMIVEALLELYAGAANGYAVRSISSAAARTG